MRTKHHRTAIIMLVAAFLTVTALACNFAGANGPDSQATVQAVYATITAHAGEAGLPTAEVTLPADDAPEGENTPIPSVTPTPPQARTGNGSNLTIPRCVGLITVDSVDTEWVAAPRIALETATYGDSRWDGVTDLAGGANLCWTDTALYLFVQITDDIHEQNQTGDTQFRGDEVELVFDGDLGGDFYETTWDGDDRQIGLSPGNFADLDPAAMLYHPSVQAASAITLEAQQLPGGYWLEAAIPWSTLGVTPQADARYGLCLALSDNDQPGEASQDTMVSHCTALLVANPTTWITVQLAP